ncbi:MAG: SDR family oxidoreductase [Pyrinomonadaceae bacterium]
MEKVVVITGASSGIGNETARLFQSRNWRVAATMRNPEKSADLEKIVDLKLFKLDVTDNDSIKSAFSDILAEFGRIDVVVNNAGYGLVGPFEGSTEEQISRQFETNVFGLMRVTKAILPYFREKRGGTIVNVASVGGRVTFPLYSLYHGTKWAVEGFSESLQHELRQFNIRIKIIEPGPIKTEFYERSMDIIKPENTDAYDGYVSRVLPKLEKAGMDAPGPEIVAEAIFKAATDRTFKLRYSANSKMLLTLRRILPDSLYSFVVRTAVGK